MTVCINLIQNYQIDVHDDTVSCCKLCRRKMHQKLRISGRKARSTLFSRMIYLMMYFIYKCAVDRDTFGSIVRLLHIWPEIVHFLCYLHQCTLDKYVIK